MFNIPDIMLSHWEEQGEPKATADDIARIEAAVGSTLPLPYIEFVTRYGFVVFEDIPGMKDAFPYTISADGEEGLRQGDISFFHEPSDLIQIYKYSTTAASAEDDTRPLFPANFVPVASNAGQGQILVEIGEHAGRVWYWTEKEWAWGMEDNTWLGFVADDFYKFINKLQPFVSPRDGGLPL